MIADAEVSAPGSFKRQRTITPTQDLDEVVFTDGTPETSKTPPVVVDWSEPPFNQFSSFPDKEDVPESRALEADISYVVNNCRKATVSQTGNVVVVTSDQPRYSLKVDIVGKMAIVSRGFTRPRKAAQGANPAPVGTYHLPICTIRIPEEEGRRSLTVGNIKVTTASTVGVIGFKDPHGSGLLKHGFVNGVPVVDWVPIDLERPDVPGDGCAFTWEIRLPTDLPVVMV